MPLNKPNSYHQSKIISEFNIHDIDLKWIYRNKMDLMHCLFILFFQENNQINHSCTASLHLQCSLTQLRIFYTRTSFTITSLTGAIEADVEYIFTITQCSVFGL